MKTVAIEKIGARPIIVNVTVGAKPGAFSMPGVADHAVREHYIRVKQAILESGFDWPVSQVTVNVPSSDIYMDLPIALAILATTGQIVANDEVFAMGELALNGNIRCVRGITPFMLDIDGPKIIPDANFREASMFGKSIPCRNLRDAVDALANITPGRMDYDPRPFGIDMSDIQGMEEAKRAAEIAAAGNHGLLLIGAPGCGKTMIARRMMTILPEMTREALETVSRIRSVSGLETDSRRSFRCPHHTISNASMCGSAKNVGEIALASHGVFFLDEASEFRKDSLQGLAYAIKNGATTLAPVTDVTLVAGIESYDDSIANPPGTVVYYDSLIPRINDVKPLLGVKVRLKRNPRGTNTGESSEVIRKRVTLARKAQMDRQGIYNSALSIDDILPSLTREAQDIQASLNSLRIARTIADLAGSATVEASHVLEANGLAND